MLLEVLVALELVFKLALVGAPVLGRCQFLIRLFELITNRNTCLSPGNREAKVVAGLGVAYQGHLKVNRVSRSPCGIVCLPLNWLLWERAGYQTLSFQVNQGPFSKRVEVRSQHGLFRFHVGVHCALGPRLDW